MKNEELIKWCWENLQFNNCPEKWEDTYIIDIINNYNGKCYNNDGKVLSYSEIRTMFEEGE